MIPAVEIKNVTVSYYEHIALHNVSLTIAPGEFVGIIGPNGAGKTTLLTTINGLGRIHSGTVRLFGETVNRRNIRRIRTQIGYVPQQLTVDPRVPFDLQEAVLLGVYGKIGLGRSITAQHRQKAQELMAYFRIDQLKHRPVGQISGGEMQKVALARALLQEPKILLLDEPTVNLDRRSITEIIRLIEEIYRRFNLTVVMVTHQIDYLPGVCNRVVLVKEAKIIWDGEKEAGVKPERLDELFSG